MPVPEHSDEFHSMESQIFAAATGPYGGLMIVVRLTDRGDKGRPVMEVVSKLDAAPGTPLLNLLVPFLNEVIAVVADTGGLNNAAAVRYIHDALVDALEGRGVSQGGRGGEDLRPVQEEATKVRRLRPMPTPPPPSRPRAYPIGSLFRGTGKGSENVYRLALQHVGGEYRETIPESEVELLIPEAAHVSELVDSAVELTGGDYRLESVIDLAKNRQQILDLRNGLEIAWGIIANAYDGDWAKAPESWRSAAVRWRDGVYHPAIPPPSATSAVIAEAARAALDMADLMKKLNDAEAEVARWQAIAADQERGRDAWKELADRLQTAVGMKTLATVPENGEMAVKLIAAIGADLEAWKRLVNEIEKAAGLTAFATAPDQSAPVLDTVRALRASRSVAAAREQDQARKYKDLMDDREMYIRAWHRELGFLIPNKSHMIDALVLRTREIVEVLRNYSPAKAKAVLDRAEFPEPTRENLTPERAANLSAVEAVDDWVERNGVRLSAKDTVDLYGVVATMLMKADGTAGRSADSQVALGRGIVAGMGTPQAELTLTSEADARVFAEMERSDLHPNPPSSETGGGASGKDGYRCPGCGAVHPDPIPSAFKGQCWACAERCECGHYRISHQNLNGPDGACGEAIAQLGPLTRCPCWKFRKSEPRPEAKVKVDRRQWMMNRLAAANRNLEEDGYSRRAILVARETMSDARRFIETGGEYPRPIEGGDLVMG